MKMMKSKPRPTILWRIDRNVCTMMHHYINIPIQMRINTAKYWNAKTIRESAATSLTRNADMWHQSAVQSANSFARVYHKMDCSLAVIRCVLQCANLNRWKWTVGSILRWRFLRSKVAHSEFRFINRRILTPHSHHYIAWRTIPRYIGGFVPGSRNYEKSKGEQK